MIQRNIAWPRLKAFRYCHDSKGNILVLDSGRQKSIFKVGGGLVVIVYQTKRISLLKNFPQFFYKYEPFYKYKPLFNLERFSRVL